MKDSRIEYVCPRTLEPLDFIPDSNKCSGSGYLISKSGNKYRVNDGIPDLTYPPELLSNDFQSRNEYDNCADSYDENMSFTTKTFQINENQIRNNMIDLLNLKENSRVLEFGAGSGRDSELISDRLGEDGVFCIQELSSQFLNKAVIKLSNKKTNINFSVGNGSYLPFPSNYFDAVYHFGGLNTFSEIRRAMDEIARVTIPGGKVVLGDESLAPWLRKTEYGKILVNGNEMYGAELPLEHLPTNATNVNLQWIIGNAFYVLSFEINNQEPLADFDIPIPGQRGGTFNKRYFGKTEGVSQEAIELIDKASKLKGVTKTDWLEAAIKMNGKEELDSK